MGNDDKPTPGSSAHLASMLEIDDNSPLLHPGVLQVTMAQRKASGEGASKRAKDTWKIIDNWLGLDGKELGPEHYSKVTKAWEAYTRMGIVPSNVVEGIPNKPPPKVMRAFDRMSQTDSSVKTSAIKYVIMVVAIVIAAITVGIYWASTFNLI